MAKGTLPVWMANRSDAGTWVPVVVGLAAVVGHTWPVFLKFKGGKGVATSAGVFLALLPFSTVLALLAFAIGFGLTKHVSVGSLCGAIVLPATAFLRHGPSPEAWLAVALGLLIFIRHIPNIKRLARGEELAVRAKEDVS
jgi:glycerol-3-phosphate acyltransferase PlsY